MNKWIELHGSNSNSDKPKSNELMFLIWIKWLPDLVLDVKNGLVPGTGKDGVSREETIDSFSFMNPKYLLLWVRDECVKETVYW